MKKLAILFIIVFSVNIYGQEDFILHINNQKMEIEPDKDYTVNVKGQEIKLNLSIKDTLIYKDEMLSFMYPKNYKVAKNDLGDGVTQFMIMNGEGSGYLIQKYTTMNPTMLNEMMLKELTKESISYGFELERKDYMKKLLTGNEVNIDRAVLTYKDEMNVYEVMSFGKKDEGILVVTMTMDSELSSESEKLISMMWNTLSLY